MDYYYKFNVKTNLGKSFVRLWHECDKAEKAAERFAAKVAAVMFYPVDSSMAGGVSCVVFKDNKCPKPGHWKSIGKDADGYELWVPNVKQRTGALALADAGSKPNAVTNRIYQKQPFTSAEGQLLLPYVELYRDDEASKSISGRYKMSWAARESIRIEKERRTLPVVSVMQILNLLQADVTGCNGDGKMHVVRPVTPTFFRYSQTIYLGCAYACKAEGLKEITMGDYLEIEKEVRAMERDNGKSK